MVSVAPEQLKEDARDVFRTPDLPESFDFFIRLSPLNQRLFVLELWESLSRCAISDDEQDLKNLVTLVEEWEATADLDAVPEVAEAIRRPKQHSRFDVA